MQLNAYAPSALIARRTAARGAARGTRLVARVVESSVAPCPDGSPAEAAPAAAAAAAPQPEYYAGILMQGFGWDSHKQDWYKVLQGKVDELKALDVTHIWLPPPSQSVAPQGYMPGQLYNLDSAYGKMQDLVELIGALKAAGISPLADVVINHRCADKQDDQGRYNDYRDDVDHEGHRIDWGRWAVTGDDPHFGGQGNHDTGANFNGAPDLDHANPDLREALKHWLQWLSSDAVGFEAWRFDFVKGYHPRFVGEYVDATTGGRVLNVGELWTDMDWGGEGGALAPNQNAARQALCDWIDGTDARSCAFDFPTKGILQEAVGKVQYWRLRDADNKAPGLIGWWPTRAVTFAENHDTGSSQAHWPFPSDKMGAGYAYILTHPGIPCLFWEHVFDWGDKLRKEIDALLKVRKAAGIQADSALRILAAEADLYVACVEGKVTLKLGPRYDMPPDLVPKEEDGWSLACSGTDYCVWSRA